MSAVGHEQTSRHVRVMSAVARLLSAISGPTLLNLKALVVKPRKHHKGFPVSFVGYFNEPIKACIRKFHANAVHHINRVPISRAEPL